MIRITREAIAQWRLEHPETATATDPLIRVSVAPGGCAGLKYVLEPAVAPEPGDHRFGHDGLGVLCAPVDLPRLTGLVVDYVDAMVGGGYRFENPNAGRSCGCGESFGDAPGDPDR